MADNEDKKISAAAVKPPLSTSAQLPPSDFSGHKPVSKPEPSKESFAKAPAEKVKPPFAAAPVASEKVARVKAAMPVAPVAKAAKPKIKTASVKDKPVAPVVPEVASAAAPVKKATAMVQEAAKAAIAPPVVKTKAAPKAATTAPGKPAFAGLFPLFMLEEKTMDMSANFTGFQNAVTDAQAKAKAAFDKGTSVLGEVSDFAKGNVEAAVESGKIFAEGMQGMGSEFVTESRSAFEKMSGDIKELAAAKSPTDFFKLQGDLVRKNFDTAMAYTSKNSEAMLKLMSDTMAPLSGRMSLAVEKARAAAPTTF